MSVVILSKIGILTFSAGALLITFFGPARALLLRSRCIVQILKGEDKGESTATTVMLIHGTFARNAPWTRPNHKFSGTVRRALDDCVVSRLLWSGDNSHRQRLLAARHLANWIQNQNSARIYLIGHSHGGLIASLAATMAADRRVFVITLSTPFINVGRRAPSFVPKLNANNDLRDEKRLIVGLLMYLGVLLGAIAVLTHMWPLLSLGLLLGLVTLILPVILPYKIDALLEKNIKKIDYIGDRLFTESIINLYESNLYIMRATADEASGFLVLGQMVSWLYGFLLRPFGHILRKIISVEDWIMEFVGSQGFMRLVSRLLFFILGLGFPLIIAYSVFYSYIPASENAYIEKMVVDFIIAVIAFGAIFVMLLAHVISVVVEPVVFIFTGILAFLLHLPFSIELASKSLLVSVTVESAPIGQWKIVTVSNEKAFLAHSHLYDTDTVAELLLEIARKPA